MLFHTLSQGNCDTTLAHLYGTDKTGVLVYRNRLLDLITHFKNTFGDGDIRLFSAPGRTEVGGNHTDHQRGHVLAASVNLDMVAAVKKRSDTTIRIQSQGYPIFTLQAQPAQPIKEEEGTTLSLVRGVVSALFEKGYPIGGFDAVITSNVLKGSGLSSSAAFEVLIGTICNHLYCDGEVSAIAIAQIGQYAENVFFGKPCGLMDQMASSVGGFVAIDFYDAQNPVVEKIDFDFSQSGHALCIVDTGGNHANLTPDYAAIPYEMKSVAGFFGKEVLSQVKKETVLSHLATLREKCGDRAILRAIHFYDDDETAVSEAEALKKGDFDTFRHLVLASGLSSFRHLQNVYPCENPQEQGLSLALMLCEKILGEQGAYRVHGGGFAGTIQAFVPLSLLEPFQKEMESVFGSNKCHVLSIRPLGGVEIKA